MTRKLFLLLLFALPCLLFAQEHFIEFTAHERPEDAENDSISWLGSDKVHHEFTLKGIAATKCRLTVIAHGETLLEQSHQNRWQVVDTLSYVVFPTEEGYLTPQFMITDFNKDELEDFVFLPMTNMHGSMGYYIYLQDENGALVPLKNTASGDDDSWPAANYDAERHTIHCYMPGGVFGSSWSALYGLEGCKAFPIAMDNEVKNMQTQFDQSFTGVDGQWEMSYQRVSVALGLGYEDYDKMDVLHYWLYQEKNGLLNIYWVEGEKQDYQEAVNITGFLNEFYGDDIYGQVPGFKITDFNNDGDQDLIIYTAMEVPDSFQALIFLADRKSKKLVKLYNTADDTDIWDTPKYDSKTKTITCSRLPITTGVAFNGTYRLKEFRAEPLQKQVRDFNIGNGKDYSESTYTGKKGKWVLKSAGKDK